MCKIILFKKSKKVLNLWVFLIEKQEKIEFQGESIHEDALDSAEKVGLGTPQ